MSPILSMDRQKSWKDLFRPYKKVKVLSECGESQEYGCEEQKEIWFQLAEYDSTRIDGFVYLDSLDGPTLWL